MDAVAIPSARQTPSSTDATARRGPRLLALVGNPNSGKTSIFNALTGLRQKVANYPGVTVERKEGTGYTQHGQPFRLLDLPGTYSLSAQSPDEAITRDVLLGRRADTPRPAVFICVVDASCLERGLFLAAEVLELGQPTIIALNMLDTAEQAGVVIESAALAARLGVPVVRCRGNQLHGVTELRLAISQAEISASALRAPLHERLDLAVADVAAAWPAADANAPSEAQKRVEARLLLVDESLATQAPGINPVPPAMNAAAQACRARLSAAEPEWRQQRVSDLYAVVDEWCAAVVKRGQRRRTLTDKLDAVFLHPWLGGVILGLILTLLFYSIFSLAGYPMGWILDGFGAASEWAAAHLPPGALTSLLTDGILAGVSGVLVFLPQILLLFFFISFLEATGYLARAAFLLDRVMNRFGLHGRSFIPLLSSYACAVPGIMGARVIESPRDRLATILVAPWMSCSARLPVYFVMLAALVPPGPHAAWTRTGLMVLMYFLGTAGALVAAWIFQKLLPGDPVGGVAMELPPYRLPSLRYVLLEMWDRARLFVRRAGTVILGLSILLWAALTYPQAPGATPAEQLEHSLGGQVGRALEPAIRPLGFDWKIGIGLVASFAAREVFVSTMNIIYQVEQSAAPAALADAVAPEAPADDDQTALASVLQNQRWPDGAPVFTPLTCLSLMVFYVFALQCLSTIAVVKRETNSWRWPLFMLAYMTATAYVASLLVYQGGHLLGFH